MSNKLKLKQMLTTQQVREQEQRFEAFLQTANLPKIGRRILHFMANDAQNGLYNEHCYVHRVLRQLANVGAAYYHPNESNKFYGDILRNRAINAFVAANYPVK